MATIVFLGRLEDLAGGYSLALPLAGPTPLGQVIAAIGEARSAELAAALAEPRIRIAVGGVLAARDGLVLQPDDELAFLPPVSGG
jgi:molybdopterin synthase sulfur carrier subunit